MNHYSLVICQKVVISKPPSVIINEVALSWPLEMLFTPPHCSSESLACELFILGVSKPKSGASMGCLSGYPVFAQIDFTFLSNCCHFRRHSTSSDKSSWHMDMYIVEISKYLPPSNFYYYILIKYLLLPNCDTFLEILFNKSLSQKKTKFFWGGAGVYWYFLI